MQSDDIFSKTLGSDGAEERDRNVVRRGFDRFAFGWLCRDAGEKAPLSRNTEDQWWEVTASILDDTDGWNAAIDGWKETISSATNDATAEVGIDQ